MTLNLKDISISLDLDGGTVSSLKIKGKERLSALSPLFKIRLRNRDGNYTIITSSDAKGYTSVEDGIMYFGFDKADLTVLVKLSEEDGELAWRITVTPSDDQYLVEWVDFPAITLPHLKLNNDSSDGGEILYPYNEGVLISDINLRENMWLKHADAEYPSKGCYSVFPNMICSQMLAYIWDDCSLYIGAHDTRRAVKEIDFIKENDGVTLRFRLFSGCNFGEAFVMDYPIVFSVTEGQWEAAAERYRAWFESNLPKSATKIADNENLPDWYHSSPLVVTYPIRGVHDTDKMEPNKLYPYTNALPMLKDIKSKCGSDLLVLLMHWEGTAPWAPPHVWPPYGGLDNFTQFLTELHRRGDRLGVYCSGFGYTIQSNLIDSYNNEKEYSEKGLKAAMCAAPNGEVQISNICTDQRVGYDICPASDIGKELLRDSYYPLLSSNLDYVQILDQNHGGGQYFCYSKEHGHAPTPGVWMTENMQDMLTEWNNIADKTLLGCESAAAEPFIGNLLYSDNRFELNYMLGTPVPLYAYIYHEYVRNFMGNQVCCPFDHTVDTLRYRLAYSFSIGDSMTLVLTQDGELASNWGVKDFTHTSDKDKTFRLIKNLTSFYNNKAQKYLYSSKMIAAPKVECAGVTFKKSDSIDFTFPAVFSSAWEANDGDRALILVNPGDNSVVCTVNGEEIAVPTLDAVIIHI